MSKIGDWFQQAWKWVTALWEKHDDSVIEMVQAVLPLVIDVALRTDLTGDQKRKVVVDAILDNAGRAAGSISSSLLNEAVEVAVNKYHIQIGKLTIDKIDAAREAALKAGRDFANGKLKITGNEAETAGVGPVIPPADGNTP